MIVIKKSQQTVAESNRDKSYKDKKHFNTVHVPDAIAYGRVVRIINMVKEINNHAEWTHVRIKIEMDTTHMGAKITGFGKEQYFFNWIRRDLEDTFRVMYGVRCNDPGWFTLEDRLRVIYEAIAKELELKLKEEGYVL